MTFRFCVLTLLVLVASTLEAQIRVSITPPPFQEVGEVLLKLLELTQEEGASSQQQIDAFLRGPLGTLEVQADERINSALAKPLVFRGLSEAATLPLLAFTKPIWQTKRVSFVLGIGAGVTTDVLDPAVLEARFQTLNPNEDYAFGASLQPLSAALYVTPFPGEWSLGLGAFGSYSTVAYSPVILTTWSAGGALVARWGPPGASWGPFAWEGLALSAGGGWAQNRFDTSLTVALPNQTVEMNLTYVSDMVTVSANPSFRLSLDNRGLFWPVQLSTEVAVAQSLRLVVAGGMVWSQGWSSVGVSGTNPVYLKSQSGILTQFVGNQASVTVEGTTGGTSGPGWEPFLTVTPSWAVGAFRIGTPLTVRQGSGVTGSLVWGIAL